MRETPETEQIDKFYDFTHISALTGCIPMMMMIVLEERRPAKRRITLTSVSFCSKLSTDKHVLRATNFFPEREKDKATA
jgi:hypothetical protein